MSIQDLGSIGELVAALATLVTLAYLATQVRQAKREFHQSSQRARTEFTVGLGQRSAAVQLAWFSPAGRNQTMMKALLTDEKLDREEAYEFAVQMSIFFGELIHSEFLHERVLLDPEFVHTRRSIYRPYLEMPRVRKWWKRHGNQFYAYAGASQMVDQMIEEIEARAEPRASTSTTGPPPARGAY